MKTLILNLSFLTTFFLATSFTNEGGIIQGRYYVNDISAIRDEAVISFYDLASRLSAGGVVCPGTGVMCIITLDRDRDGDLVYLVSQKGKGRDNIEIY